MKRSATRSSKNKRKGKKGGGSRAARSPFGQLPAGGQFPAGGRGGQSGGQPALPPGGLPSNFSMPNIDFSKLRKPEK